MHAYSTYVSIFIENWPKYACNSPMHAAMTDFLDRNPCPTTAEETLQQRSKRARHSDADDSNASMCLPCGASPVLQPGASSTASLAACEDEDQPDQLEGSLCYIHSDRLLKAATRHPQHPMRTLLVHSLVEACGLLEHLDIVEECDVDRIDLTKFHSRCYVDFLRKPNTSEQQEYGCDYDCPCFPQMWEYARAVVGGTLSAARKLVDGEARVAMHFNGGRHHAKPDRADGFCYVNDICIAIFELLAVGPVLYIDIDCHHGDGVEQAFYSSSRVRECSLLVCIARSKHTLCPNASETALALVTLSLHRYGPGYFPGTGSVDSTGSGSGAGYACNVPLKSGVGDERYLQLFCPIADAARRALQPGAVVLQCGADALSRDPLGELNLTTVVIDNNRDLFCRSIKTYSSRDVCTKYSSRFVTEQAYTGVVRHVLDWQVPLLILGGGGYHNADSARCYTAIAAEVAGVKLPRDVPEHDYLSHYGPQFSMASPASNMLDENTEEELLSLEATVLANLAKLHKVE